MSALRRRKEALRAQMRRIRGTIPPEERLRLGNEIQSNLFLLPQLSQAKSVLLFYSFGSEVPTAGMIERLLDRGVQVLLPYLDGEEMNAGELRPGDSLTATTYGPKEPVMRIAVEPDRVDAVIAPGLAFDPHGYRLGYGGGHYDRYLARLRPEATRVGVAFHLQVVPSVPHGRGDVPVDFLVTERETMDCRTPPGGA